MIMLPSVRRRIARDFEPLKRLPRGVVLAAGALMITPVALALFALQAKASESELAASAAANAGAYTVLTSSMTTVTSAEKDESAQRVEAPCVTKPAETDDAEQDTDDKEEKATTSSSR
jgi:hypothetical protein